VLRETHILIAAFLQGQEGLLQKYQVARLLWAAARAVTRLALAVRQQQRRLDIVHHRPRYRIGPRKYVFLDVHSIKQGYTVGLTFPVGTVSSVWKWSFLITPAYRDVICKDSQPCFMVNKVKETYVVHGLVGLILTERLPLLYMCALLDVPLNDLDFGDAWTENRSARE
jgi:hypothetical protein